LAASAVLFGLTAWSVPGIVGAACGDAFGPSLAGAALGFVTLFLGVGQAVGPLVGGALADAYVTFVPAYLLAAAIALVGALGALFLPTMRAPGISLQAHVAAPEEKGGDGRSFERRSRSV
jgi:MFS family permease